MHEQRVPTIGHVMPNDFPTAPYNAIHLRLVGVKSDSFWEYARAWNAVAYRFLFCAEHDEAFTKSIQQNGDNPWQPERYIQEKALFGFFVTGLSTIDSLCYGLFAIASMINPETFPITTPSDRRSIKPEKTATQFAKAFPEEGVTKALQQMTISQEYLDWKEIRNILIHRSAPGRGFHEGGPYHGKVLWVKGIQVDETTTSSRRKWLAEAISVILNEADHFTKRYF